MTVVSITVKSELSSPVSSEALNREQMRLRSILAGALLTATCLFAAGIAWLGKDSPLQPLLLVRVSLLALLGVYAVSVGVAFLYARWIRKRRDPAIAAMRMHERASSRKE